MYIYLLTLFRKTKEDTPLLYDLALLLFPIIFTGKIINKKHKTRAQKLV